MPKKHPTKPRVVREAAVADVLEVPAGTFKNTCLQILDDVRDRRVEVVVTKHGKPVARVVPMDEAPRSSLGWMRGTVEIVGDIVSPDFEEWGEYA
jgi:prevent-host-death family protein